MNKYHQALIPILFLLAISIDESVQFDLLQSIRRLENLESESIEHMRAKTLNGLDSNEESGSKSSSEENGSRKHYVNSEEESGSKSSDEKSGSKNSNEESKNSHFVNWSANKHSNLNNGNENSKEQKKIENSQEKNGIEFSNEKNGKENVNEKNGIKFSYEKNGNENVNEKNGITFSHEKNGNENVNEKNGNQNFNEKNGNENSKEKNGYENSKEKNGNENFKEKNENENSEEKNRRKDDTDDNKFTVIMVNDGGNPLEEYESGNPFANLVENPMMGKEIKSSIPMRYLNTVQAFHKAKIFQYPYHVAIVWKPDGRLLCQGALIKPGWIITSASCIHQYELHYKTLTVLMGIDSLRDPAVTSRDILEVIIYPDFIPDQNLNDLALMMLDGDVSTNRNLEPVAMSKPYNPSDRKCQFSTFIGNTLYGKSIEFIFQENCDVLEIEGQTLPYFCASINGSLINSSKRSTYGSPLVCGGVIYGIKTKNTLFSSVDTLIPWINDMIQMVTAGNKA